MKFFVLTFVSKKRRASPISFKSIRINPKFLATSFAYSKFAKFFSRFRFGSIVNPCWHTILLFISIIILCNSPVKLSYAGDVNNPHTGTLQILTDFQEEDGTPTVYAPYAVKFPNTSVTDNGDGTVSIDWTTLLDLRYLMLVPQAPLAGDLDFNGQKLYLHQTDDHYLYRTDTNTVKLYVSGILVHTWESGAAAINKLLLDDGTSHILLSDGASKILIT